ncbi:uncharacterized protein N7487_011668 [Penicillium crustosum]|uniref:uncharacterized protein n=1 Tax=Penicillium crustosum TaxID=36656 RepID=UPI0023914E88|nr:uncharacterized protein N7487_011668 [Penicillium crustosum]KAJ5394027.1 hypothetical protein N7487_011668 [Penicillium crustosum]
MRAAPPKPNRDSRLLVLSMADLSFYMPISALTLLCSPTHNMIHTTIGCGKQGFPSAQPYLSHTPSFLPPYSSVHSAHSIHLNALNTTILHLNILHAPEPLTIQMTVGKKKKEGHLGESNLILNINSLEVTHHTTNSPARGLCTVNKLVWWVSPG